MQPELEVCFERTQTREYTWFSFDMSKSKGVQLHEGVPSKQQVEQARLNAEAEERAEKHKSAGEAANGETAETEGESRERSGSGWRQGRSRSRSRGES